RCETSDSTKVDLVRLMESKPSFVSETLYSAGVKIPCKSTIIISLNISVFTDKEPLPKYSFSHCVIALLIVDSQYPFVMSISFISSQIDKYSLSCFLNNCFCIIFFEYYPGNFNIFRY